MRIEGRRGYKCQQPEREGTRARYPAVLCWPGRRLLGRPSDSGLDSKRRNGALGPGPGWLLLLLLLLGDGRGVSGSGRIGSTNRGRTIAGRQLDRRGLVAMRVASRTEMLRNG